MPKVLHPQTGAGFLLKEGESLKVIDPTGQQVADLYCAFHHDSSDGLSSGRTIDYNESIRLKIGDYLYSHKGNRLAQLIEDTSPGIHDLLVTPCSLQMFHMMNKNEAYHPSCHENLTVNLKSFSLEETQITSTVNIFMNVQVQTDGRIKILPPESQKNNFVIFKACKDLIVGLTACSDEGTNNGSCKSIHYEILNS